MSCTVGLTRNLGPYDMSRSIGLSSKTFYFD